MRADRAYPSYSGDDATTMASTWMTLLEPFSKGHQLPAQARTEPHVPQKQEEPMTITRLWQYLPFLAVQGELSGCRFEGDTELVDPSSGASEASCLESG